MNWLARLLDRSPWHYLLAYLAAMAGTGAAVWLMAEVATQ